MFGILCNLKINLSLYTKVNFELFSRDNQDHPPNETRSGEFRVDSFDHYPCVYFKYYRENCLKSSHYFLVTSIEHFYDNRVHVVGFESSLYILINIFRTLRIIVIIVR